MDKQKNKKEYIALRLGLAEDKIKVAKLLLDNNEYRDAISRAYYAVFYAAKAFLLSKDQDPSSHKGVDILFRKFCTAHKKPDVSFAKMLSVMREARLNADYKEKTTISFEDAREAIDMAASFIKEIESLIG